VTVDEDLDLLENLMRRLKIEYEVFFINPRKRPPTDIEWKVLNLLRKFSDGNRMKFAQRYRYNGLAQRYAMFSDLWRKKARIREEGIRKPQDAVLSVRELRTKITGDTETPTVYGVRRKAEVAPKVPEAKSATAAADSGADDILAIP
jgi:hypothetical protein